MKQATIILLISLLSLNVSAQTKLSAAEQKTVIERMDKAAKAMTSMQCDFEQTKSMKMMSKKMVSKGIMYFRRPDKLRWQYTSPYDYTFVLNGDKVRIKSSKSTQNIDVKQNKMFRQITDVIVKSVTGGSLKSNADFQVELYKKNKTYSARMYPKKKEVKQVYKFIELTFNSGLTMVSSVRMEEKTGDVTIVRLNNVKTNTKINDKVFDIN